MSGPNRSSPPVFNLETMSGVYPGTRTAAYHRLRLYSLQNEPDVQDEPVWFQLFWFAEPSSVVLMPYQPGESDRRAQVLVQLQEPQPERIARSLGVAVAERGWRLQSCGTCRHWQRLALTTAEGLAAGECRWQLQETQENTSRVDAPELAVQSSLSLDCAHWQSGMDGEVSEQSPNTQGKAAHLDLQMKKAAELDPDRLPFWRRVRWRVQQRFQSLIGQEAPRVPLVERSGVGAGTEPCFACHGRIANLGALAVESPDGDKETFSVWRCRNCHTLFANDWIDRWERLDNLETEETFYRLAPAEAHALLSIILSASGGEHPARRKERAEQRARIVQILASLPVLSHQIRQGR